MGALLNLSISVAGVSWLPWCWRANVEEALTPISVDERPLGERLSPETGGMLLSACQSYFPDSLDTYFILAGFTASY